MQTITSLQFVAAAYAAVLLTLFIDQWIGEPPPRWHPVVWMGNYLGWAGRWLQARVEIGQSGAGDVAGAADKADAADWASFWRGAAVWWLGAVLVLLVAGGLQWLLLQLPLGWAVLLLGVALKPLLAWRMLTDEVAAVEQQLGQSLQAGQQQLARIVSRDVAVLDVVQVRESALESLAENLNDSVIAPLFWFALLGLPGAALCRFADTADSMWGYRGNYRGQCWEWAGKWAARADDVLAWLPARITAVALLLAGVVASWRKARPACHLAAGSSSAASASQAADAETITQSKEKAAKQTKTHANQQTSTQSSSICQRLAQLPRQARCTPSPNSGWPMAALALVLDVRLCKPHTYTLHAQGQTAQACHIAQAVRLAHGALLGLVALWGLAWLVAWWAVLEGVAVSSAAGNMPQALARLLPALV